MTTPDIIAYFAAFFTMIAYVPQAIKTIKTRDTKSISFWMYLLSIVGVVLWLIYGFMINSYPIIFKNISVILLSGVIFFIKTDNIVRGVDERKDLNHMKKFIKNLWKKFKF